MSSETCSHLGIQRDIKHALNTPREIVVRSGGDAFDRGRGDAHGPREPHMAFLRLDPHLPYSCRALLTYYVSFPSDTIGISGCGSNISRCNDKASVFLTASAVILAILAQAFALTPIRLA